AQAHQGGRVVSARWYVVGDDGERMEVTDAYGNRWYAYIEDEPTRDRDLRYRTGIRLVGGVGFNSEHHHLYAYSMSARAAERKARRMLRKLTRVRGTRTWTVKVPP